MRPTLCLALAALALTAFAQEKAVDTKYKNNDLGIEFDGIYGWEAKLAAGSGAWNELASYKNEPRGATVQLMIQNNPWESLDDLRNALKREFGAARYKSIQYKDVAMKKGNMLSGIQVEGVLTQTTEEGKQRESVLLSRTYLGVKRLYRVHCVVRRSQARHVRDLFDQALTGLKVVAKAEKAAPGTAVYSVRGRYGCQVPPTFDVVLHPKGKADALFTHARRGISIRVYSFRYEGLLDDQVVEMTDYYKDAITFQSEDGKLMGGQGFMATIKKDGKVTYVAGTVRNERVFRVHTIVDEKKADGVMAVHKAFVDSFKPGR